MLPLIKATCAIESSKNGIYGPGVYLTDLGPNNPRLQVSLTCWNRWRPETMTGVVRLTLIRDPVRAVAQNIWLSDPPELALAGQDIAIGWWDGSDPDDPDDQGQWTLNEDKGCNPPVHFPALDKPDIIL
jgi:hypothetical protein